MKVPPARLYSDRLYEQLAPPIDLSGGGVYQAPHLRSSALLEVGGASLIIEPEEDPIVRELQDYKIIAVGGLANYMLRQEITAEREDRFLQAVHDLDVMTAHEDGLPPGVTLVHHGEEATLGRITTPQLRLGRAVSQVHASVQINNFGVRFADLHSRNGTWLYLAPEDAQAPEEPLPSQEIDSRLSGKVVEAFRGLVVDGSLEHAEEGLVIDAELVPNPNSDQELLRLEISEADDYPNLKPEVGFMLKQITIGPTATGLSVTDFSDGEQRVSGISQATRQSHLSARQVDELLRLASNLYGS